MTNKEYLEVDDDLYELVRNYLDDDIDIISDNYFEIRDKLILLIDLLRSE